MIYHWVAGLYVLAGVALLGLDGFLTRCLNMRVIPILLMTYLYRTYPR